MDADDARLRSQDLAFALMNGHGCLEQILEGNVSPDVLAGLDELEPALVEFMSRRDKGRTAGGPHAVTAADIERLRRLRQLVRASPQDAAEIERLAGALLPVVGGD
jgi:hypothetical protein